MSFGAYPDVSLAQARKLHHEGRALLATGTDPMASRKADQMADLMTFRVVAEKWFAHWGPAQSTKHASQVWRRLELDVLPVIGAIPTNDLTTAKVRDCVKAIEARGALDIAKRQLQKCNQIMRYAVAHEKRSRAYCASGKSNAGGVGEAACNQLRGWTATIVSCNITLNGDA